MVKWKSATSRNWTVDVVKWFFMVMLVVGHAIAMCWNLGAKVGDSPSALVPGLVNVPSNGMAGTWYGWMGYYTISFFTVLCGYWFMNGFKKQQALGIHKKERTFKLTANFFGDSIRRYWPVLSCAITINVILLAVTLPEFWNYNGFVGLWQLFRNALPFMLGLTALGYTHAETYAGLTFMKFPSFINPETGAVLEGGLYKVNYAGSLWFISALLIFAVLWYFVFLKSETAGVFVWSLLHIAIYTNLGGFNNFPDMFNALTGLAGINTEYWRIFGEFGWGIFLWYIVQYIRRELNTPKGKKLVTAVEAISFINLVIMIKVGFGHMNIALLLLLPFMAAILSEVGYITPAVNKLLDKIPGIKHVGAIGLASYMYLPATCYLMSMFLYRGNWAWFSGLTFVNQMWVFLGLEFLWCVFYVLVVDRFIIKWAQRKIGKAFRLKETITEFVEEDTAQAKTTV